ncbi:hypothetical protein K438DRAFT_1772293 [Mycena galopus ATCC 62051]|nr:hypothetical protein K438DRAFT_1772293 [Mycena galopus ATCC 62051]
MNVTLLRRKDVKGGGLPILVGLRRQRRSATRGRKGVKVGQDVARPLGSDEPLLRQMWGNEGGGLLSGVTGPGWGTLPSFEWFSQIFLRACKVGGCSALGVGGTSCSLILSEWGIASETVIQKEGREGKGVFFFEVLLKFVLVWFRSLGLSTREERVVGRPLTIHCSGIWMPDIQHLRPRQAVLSLAGSNFGRELLANWHWVEFDAKPGMNSKRVGRGWPSSCVMIYRLGLQHRHVRNGIEGLAVTVWIKRRSADREFMEISDVTPTECETVQPQFADCHVGLSKIQCQTVGPWTRSLHVQGLITIGPEKLSRPKMGTDTSRGAVAIQCKHMATGELRLPHRLITFIFSPESLKAAAALAEAAGSFD